MSHFDEKDQISIARFVLEHLVQHELFVLGTVDEKGDPWTVCLNLAFDKSVDIIWKSLATTEHSKHIVLRPHVSICVFSHTSEFGDFGFYAKAAAHEVTSESELSGCLDVRYKQKGKEVPPLSRFLNNVPDRIYVAELTEAWINDDRYIKTLVDLETLKDFAK